MDPQKMMGLQVPADQRVSVTVRDWNAMKLALWRSKVAWEIAEREAKALVARASHMEGCPAQEIETEPCLSDCPDRELRLSALVILNAARQFAPVNVRNATQTPYFAPSREYYAAIMAELSAAQAELATLRGDQTTQPAPAT